MNDKITKKIVLKSVNFKYFDKYYSNIEITYDGRCSLKNDTMRNDIEQPQSFPIKSKLNFNFNLFLFQSIWAIIFKANSISSIIAPYWTPKPDTNSFFYRIPDSLEDISCEIRESFPTFKNFKSSNAWIFTWYRMIEKNNRNAKSNTYQLVIVTDNTYSFIIYNYAELNWPSSNRINNYVSGYNAEFGKIFKMMPLEKSVLVSGSNVGIPSKWIFRVDTEGFSLSYFKQFLFKIINFVLK